MEELPEYMLHLAREVVVSPSSTSEVTYTSEDMMRMFGSLIEENARLRKDVSDAKDVRYRNEELEEENKILRESLVEERIEVQKGKKLLKLAQDNINANATCKPTGYPSSGFNYEYDLSDYAKEAEAKDVELIFDSLLFLTDSKLNATEYVIQCATDVAMVYIVMHDSQKLQNTKYHYLGTLTNFCDAWNNNVVARIKDEGRRQLLTCNYPTIKAELNKPALKGCSQGSWRLLSLDSSIKKRKQYSRGVNIKARIEKMLV